MTEMTLPYQTDPKTQEDRVLAIMCDRRWRTLADIVLLCSHRFGHMESEGGVHARLRSFRRKGRYLDKRVVAGANKLYEYRLSKESEAK